MKFQDANRAKGTRLACFSPPVMLATFAIEMSMLCYSMWRYRLNQVGRLIIALLFFLGFFQLSEYFVCGGLGMSSVGWGRAGYIAITMLPPLGLHLLHILADKKVGKLVVASYATALALIGVFLTYDQAFTGYVCTGNYVIFQLAPYSSYVYGVYYYGWLLATIGIALRWSRELSIRGKRYAQRRRNSLMLVVGYLVFLVPTAIANTVTPETRSGVPSIMCGFAVLFACILVGYILPNAGLQRSGRR